MKRRILSIVAVAVWAFGMASWFPLASIENGALSHPDHAVGQLTAPLQVKGVVRYVTPRDALIDQIAQVTFVGCVLTFIAIAVTLRRGRHAT